MRKGQKFVKAPALVALMLVMGMMLAAMPVRAEEGPVLLTGTTNEGAYAIAVIPDGLGDYRVHGVIVRTANLPDVPRPGYGNTYVNIGKPIPGEWHNFYIMNGGERTGIGVNVGSIPVQIYSDEAGKPINVTRNCPYLYDYVIWGISTQRPPSPNVDDLINYSIELVGTKGDSPSVLDDWILVIG